MELVHGPQFHPPDLIQGAPPHLRNACSRSVWSLQSPLTPFTSFLASLTQLDSLTFIPYYSLIPQGWGAGEIGRDIKIGKIVN